MLIQNLPQHPQIKREEMNKLWEKDRHEMVKLKHTNYFFQLVKE